VLHRITGVTIFFFLFAHVIDTSMVRVSPHAYNVAVETYKNPSVGLMEVGLVGAVLFHALNGIRIVLVDFWEKGPRYQKQLFYGVVGAFVVLFVPFVVRHLTHVFGG
jgi:succinate dehydrogenase / fumarate reductase, cytochrome b subunit